MLMACWGISDMSRGLLLSMRTPFLGGSQPSRIPVR